MNPQIDYKKRFQQPVVKKSMKIAQMSEIQLEQKKSLQIGSVQDIQNPDELFNLLCEKGKAVLNILIKEKLQDIKQKQDERTKNIFNEPLGVIFLKQPKIIDFDNKMKYFKLELKQLKA